MMTDIKAASIGHMGSIGVQSY